MLLATLVGCGCTVLGAQTLPSQRVADAAMKRWPAGACASQMAGPGVSQLLLQGIDAVWLNSADKQYFEYMRTQVDGCSGSEDMALGRELLRLYAVTQDKWYLERAETVFAALQKVDSQIAEADSAEPFKAEYALLSHRAELLPEITRELLDRERQMHARKGDAGAYMMTLVDALACYPDADAGKQQLIAALGREAATAGSSQDSTATSLRVYALARGVREGYLPQRYLTVAQRAYRGVMDRRRDGRDATGAFLLASTEMENVQNAKLGHGDVVMVDGWFNNEKHLDAFGRQVYFHFKWDYQGNPGYSMLGHIFRNFGAATQTLLTEPTAAALRGAQVYVIASPDTASRVPAPNYANAEDAKQVAEWVKAGGVLMIMENDSGMADLKHFNVISEQFGIHFNDVLRNHVIGNDIEKGTLVVRGGEGFFHQPHTLYMKDTCTITVSAAATTLMTDHGDVMMATAKYGKGTVFAVVDPWLYNEYTNGLKLPGEYDNYAGGVELVRWILQQVPRGPLVKDRTR
jgi:unsaturated rhamnogalacturonyl hydrolase